MKDIPEDAITERVLPSVPDEAAPTPKAPAVAPAAGSPPAGAPARPSAAPPPLPARASNAPPPLRASAAPPPLPARASKPPVAPLPPAAVPFVPPPPPMPAMQTAPMLAPQAPPMPFLAGPPPSGPYRAPEPPPPPPPPVYIPPSQRRAAHPILGPSLSVFAVLLWSFVIGGQFTTSWFSDGSPLPAKYALAFVTVLTFIAWIAAIRVSRAAVPARTGAHMFGRVLGITALTAVLFTVTLFIATIIGSSGGNHDFSVAAVLVFLALAAALAGPHWAWPNRPDSTHGQKVRATVLWLMGTILTLVAAGQLAANG